MRDGFDIVNPKTGPRLRNDLDALGEHILIVDEFKYFIRIIHSAYNVLLV